MAYLFNLNIIVNFVLGFFFPGFFQIALFQFLIKITLDTIFQYKIARFFNRENLLWLFLPIQIVHMIYIIFIGPAGSLLNTHWKGRRIR